MPHFAVASTRDFDAAVQRAGNAALGLWTRAGAWSVARLTDGHVPREVALMLGTEPQVRRLVAAGLWAETADGYAYTTWESDGNRTRIEVESVSNARRKAGRLGGVASGKARQRTPDSGSDTPPDQGVPEPSASSKTNPLPSPTLPYPQSPSETGARGARPRPTLPAELQGVVDAWAEGAGASPVRPELQQILGDARQLIDAGTPIADIRDGARLAGIEGRPTIRVSVRKVQAGRRPQQSSHIDGWQALKSRPERASGGVVIDMPQAAGGER